MAVLVVADHDNSAIVPIVLNTVTAAGFLSDDVHILVAGEGGAAAAEAAKIVGVSKVVAADNAAYSHQLAESCLLYTSPSPRDATLSRMPSSA